MAIDRAVNFFLKLLFPERHAQRIGVRIGRDCRLIGCDYSSEPYLITLGDRVSATRVRFETHDGGVWVLRNGDPDIDVVRPITVGNNVFIGYGAMIMPGVTIGNNVVIGAKALVTRDIPDDSVAVGIPARVIKGIDGYRTSVRPHAEATKRLRPEQKRAFYLRKFGKSQ